MKKKRKMRILKQSHSAEKLERGNALGFLNFNLLQNIKKLEAGPFGDKKLRKKSHSAEKIQRGDPLVPPGFVSFVRN